jgi:hypothetical protein
MFKEDCSFETHFKEELQMKKFTIIALVVAITAVFAVSAMANEWNLYGSARMATFYTQRDYGNLFNTPLDQSGNDEFGKDNYKQTQWALQGNSRVGATVKGDMLEGRFEFGVNDVPTGGGTVTARRIYGVWKFADGWGLKVGKDYTPVTFFLSGQVFDADAGLLQVGNAYGARRGQVAVEGNLGPGMFKFAAITQTSANITFTDTDALGNEQTVTTQTESYWPKLETSYMMKFGDNMSAHAFGGFQSTKYYANNDVTGADTSKTISSYMVGLGGEFNFGPMFIKPQASYYYNGAAGGWLGLAGANAASYSGLPANLISDIAAFGLPVIVNGDSDNVKSTMAMLALGFSPTEALTLEGGIGWLYQKADGQQSIDKNTYLEYYLQAVWKMAPSVYLIPEVGYRDFGDAKFSDPNVDDVDLGSLFYFGAKWQIDF